MQEESGMSPAAPSAGLASLGVAAAADAIRKGEISSEAYATALLQRARNHSDLNAFITIDEQAVLEASRSADKARTKGASAPLLGVPIGIKDSYLTRGLRTTLGISALNGFVPDKDADAVAEIKGAGGIVFGKNNLVEMSYGLTGHNSAHGQVKNPHGRSHVSGGSSSGSAASVAARLVPASLGGDTIGSIRVPASFCGVVGFKPTTGRWPRAGVAPISHTLDTTGVFARSVEDCLLIDEVVTRNATPDAPARHGLRGVKLAYAPLQYLQLLAPEVGAHFEDTLRRLRDAGAEIVEIDLGADFSALALSATWNIFFRETRDAVAGFLQQNNIPVTFEALHACLKAELKNVWAQFVVPTGAGYLSAKAYDTVLSVERVEIKRRLEEAFSTTGAEALLFPTTPCTAPTIEQQAGFLIAGQEVSYTAIAQNTIPTSAAGLPGISIPIGFTQENLPIGLEIDGAHGKDRSLLHLARRIEATVGRLSSPV